MNNWKKFFKPFRIDDTIVIKPTWENLTDSKPDDLIIEIDPVFPLAQVPMKPLNFVS